MGNLTVPFDVSNDSSSFLNFAIPLDVGKKLMCLANAAKWTKLPPNLNVGI